MPLNNLYTIYEARGDNVAAEEMHKRVERHRRRNPYYLHHLAETLMEERRYHEAIELLEKAIRIEDEEYRFHYALAQSQYQVGLQQPARASLQRAIQLVPSQQGIGPLELPEGS